MPNLFKIFDVDRTKNGEVMQFTLLEQEINGHMEKIDAVVIDLNSIDIFLRYNWLVKHNPEVNWNKGTKATGQKSKALQISRKF